MVKIDTKLAVSHEIEEGKSYIIEDVELVRTLVRGYNGYRVVMRSINKQDKNTYATMLWNRDIASASSKLGAFLSAFIEFFGDPDKAYETDNWKGHVIKVVSWQPRRREIKVLQ